MANGDTKTESYLRAAAEGTRADLPSDTCCNTKTQNLILGVANRIMDVEDEVEELKNNPDVVDIVDTYADLQAYSTSGLTDKDVIRVIADETKGGLSSYYRWNSPNPGWNFVGVIPGGDGIKELSSADYNYPTVNPDRVALWLLDNGLYTAPAGVMVAASTTSYPWYNTSDKTILVGGSDTVKGIYTFLNNKTDVVTTQVSDGTEADEYTLLKSNQVLQTTGQSATDTMSQKAITDAIAGGGGGPTVVQTTGTSTTDVMSQNAVTNMVFADPGTNRKVRIGNTSTNGNDSISIGSGGSAGGNFSVQIGGGVASNAFSIAIGSGVVYADNSIAIGRNATVPTGSAYRYSIALGAYAKTSRGGEVNIGTGTDNHGYNSTNYRVLGGVHDGQDAHDAVTVSQVNSVIDSINTALSTNIPHIGA